jgi:hypothetical protein
MIPRTGAAPSPKRRGTSSPPRKVVAALRFHQRVLQGRDSPRRGLTDCAGVGMAFRREKAQVEVLAGYDLPPVPRPPPPSKSPAIRSS